jgi:hypothetical protein
MQGDQQRARNQSDASTAWLANIVDKTGAAACLFQRPRATLPHALFDSCKSTFVAQLDNDLLAHSRANIVARYIIVIVTAAVAPIYVGLGDNDQAMAWLERAYQARFNPSILLRPAFDPLRADLRFRDLRARIGLPLN